MVGRPAIVEPTPTPLPDGELIARMFRTLGDATRLAIVELLISEGELYQVEIVELLGASQARVSEHLACLTWCGFVSARRQGRKTIYRVSDRRVRRLISSGHRFLDTNQAAIASCRTMEA